MKKTLGIDLGSNSLGWAIVDDITADIIDKGVIVFPEGVDAEAKSSLETPAATRRVARMGRRIKFRRKLRKFQLLELLIGAKMCPLSIEELSEWKRSGKYPVGNLDFIRWLKSTDTTNPYCDRDAASRGKVAPLVLGRALYHLCQRRGFKSARKDESLSVDAETEAAAQDKELGKVKDDISKLTGEISAAGCKTLGQYFFKVLDSQKNAIAKTRIRNRYTGRNEHYEHEFAVIMDAQGYATDDKFRGKLHEAMFYQRPLRSQSHLVGFCPLEPKNRRAQISHPDFEEFRMLAFINNLVLERADGEFRDEFGYALEPLAQDDRDAICKVVAKTKAPTFKTILKLFRKDPRFAAQEMQFHYYRGDDAVPSCPTRKAIADAFGDVTYDEQKVFDALTYFDDREKLAGWFRKHYPKLAEKDVVRLSKLYPKEGNAKYSLKAIRKMLPFLRRGFELSHARFCARLPDLVPDYKNREADILRRLDECLFQYRHEKVDRANMAPQLRKNAGELPSLYDRYRQCLTTEFGMSEEDFDNGLYLRNDEIYEKETCYYPHGKRGECVKLARPRLPKVNLGMIRNPIVQRSMTTLRRLVNYLGDHGKLDTDDTIRIELARTVNDFATRSAWQEWQKQRRALREEAAAEVAKYCPVNDDAIERYILWKEQGYRCLYTGRKIKVAELFGGNSVDIEHTLPRSLCGDDSLANKTVCDARYNRDVKRGCVPRNCPNWPAIDTLLADWRKKLADLEKTYTSQSRKANHISDPAAKCKARIKAGVTKLDRDYWREKLRRFDMNADKFTVREGEGLGFKRRQMVDTGIMCSHAVDLLRCLYPKTYAVNGVATSLARKAWGIQADEAKDRSEHTHHAKDAMVIAALSPSRFTAICTALKDDGVVRGKECDVCAPPCTGFADKVRIAVGEILVKHILRQTTMRQSSKRNVLAFPHPPKGRPDAKFVKKVLSRGDTVRGQLHKDTFYGCIMVPGSCDLKKVVRKSLVGPIKDAAGIVDKIVDPAIRNIVSSAIDKLKDSGIKNIEPGMITMPSGVPINKVRIFTPTATNASELRMHDTPSRKSYKNPYYVTSGEGSNFRLALFEKDGKFTTDVDNSLDWAQNHKKPDYDSLDQREGFIGYVLPGAMALAHSPDNPEELRQMTQVELSKRLYKVVKFSGSGQMTLRRHIEARAITVLKSDLKAAGKLENGESKIDLKNPHELLLVTRSVYGHQMLFEGIHFKMMLDGTIRFL